MEKGRQKLNNFAHLIANSAFNFPHIFELLPILVRVIAIRSQGKGRPPALLSPKPASIKVIDAVGSEGGTSHWDVLCVWRRFFSCQQKTVLEVIQIPYMQFESSWCLQQQSLKVVSVIESAHHLVWT